jgi:EpsI family protein
MLSIAYGDDQRRALQIHRPEVCYAAGGFRILMQDKTQIRTMDSLIPVMHLVAKQDNRLEPITYWVRIGKTLVRGNIEQGLARLHYRFNGYIADGLLFRVSSIDTTPSRAFEIQDQFVTDLKAALPEERRWTIFGDT